MQSSHLIFSNLVGDVFRVICVFRLSAFTLFNYKGCQKDTFYSLKMAILAKKLYLCRENGGVCPILELMLKLNKDEETTH